MNIKPGDSVKIKEGIMYPDQEDLCIGGGREEFLKKEGFVTSPGEYMYYPTPKAGGHRYHYQKEIYYYLAESVQVRRHTADWLPEVPGPGRRYCPGQELDNLKYNLI